MDAYEMDLITEEDLTAAAEKLYTIRFLLGEFEQTRPYADIPYSVVGCKEYEVLNLEAARECMVLLKNQDGYLPLTPKKARTIAVIGPNSMSVTALEGNYNGYASEYITVADGVRRVFSNAEVRVSKGCHLWYEKQNEWNGFGNIRSDGMAIAADADLTILCLGLDSTIEGEDGMVSGDYTVGGDKRNLYLPQTQQRLAEAVCDVSENVIVVLMAGSSLDVGEKVRDHAKAIIQAWYPGAVGGLAVAQLIAGMYSPCGKLPVTFYRGDSNMPDFSDYTMEGRTYRYFRQEALYPFGYGLSYTHFAYDDFAVSEDTNGWNAEITVKNIGAMAGKEKVQVYASYRDSRTPTPQYQLCGLCCVELQPGEQKRIGIAIDAFWIQAVQPDGTRVRPDGEIILYVGGQQPDARSAELTGVTCVQKVIQKAAGT